MANPFDLSALHHQILLHLINATFWPNRKQERKRIVDAFQEIHDQRTENWMMLFQILFAINGLILGFLIYAQYTNPWGMQSHAYFKELVDAEMVIIVEGVAAMACLIGFYAFTCRCKHQKQTLTYSICLAGFVAIFWLYYMLSCFLASAYVVYLLSESQDAIDKLRACSR